jgi:hypothetical protein
MVRLCISHRLLNDWLSKIESPKSRLAARLEFCTSKIFSFSRGAKFVAACGRGAVGATWSTRGVLCAGQFSSRVFA